MHIFKKVSVLTLLAGVFEISHCLGMNEEEPSAPPPTRVSTPTPYSEQVEGNFPSTPPHRSDSSQRNFLSSPTTVRVNTVESSTPPSDASRYVHPLTPFPHGKNHALLENME